MPFIYTKGMGGSTWRYIRALVGKRFIVRLFLRTHCFPTVIYFATPSGLVKMLLDFASLDYKSGVTLNVKLHCFRSKFDHKQ